MSAARSRSGRLIVLLAATALLVAGCGGSKKPSANAKIFRVRAGVNDPTDKNISVRMFLPQEITVRAETEVVWVIAGPEPHTVTFVPPGQKAPTPDAPGALDPKDPVAGYDGKTLVSSGLEPSGTQQAVFRLTFATAGTYSYICVIHPAMTGSVKVVEQTAKADTPVQIVDRAKVELQRWAPEGRAAKKAFLAEPPKSTPNTDGSTTWVVKMGVSTEHTDVYVFHPVPVSIKPGDKVLFLNDSSAPHTATFAGTKTLPDPLSPDAGKAAPGASPQTLNLTDLFNTGSLPPNVPPGAGPPESARSFTFVVPQAGTYDYICLPHAGSGMKGSIKAA